MTGDLENFQKFLESISDKENTQSKRSRRRKMERAIKKYKINSNNDGVQTDGEGKS